MMDLVFILCLAAIATANPTSYAGFNGLTTSNDQYNPFSAQFMGGNVQQIPLQNAYYQTQPTGRDLFTVVPLQNQYQYPFAQSQVLARDLSGSTGTVAARQMPMPMTQSMFQHNIPLTNVNLPSATNTGTTTNTGAGAETPVSRNIMTDSTAPNNRNFLMQNQNVIPQVLHSMAAASQDVKANPENVKVLGKDATITMINRDDGSSILLINATHGKPNFNFQNFLDNQTDSAANAALLGQNLNAALLGQNAQTTSQIRNEFKEFQAAQIQKELQAEKEIQKENVNWESAKGNTAWKPSGQSVISALTNPTTSFVQSGQSASDFQTSQVSNQGIKNTAGAFQTETKPVFAVPAGPIRTPSVLPSSGSWSAIPSSELVDIHVNIDTKPTGGATKPGAATTAFRPSGQTSLDTTNAAVVNTASAWTPNTQTTGNAALTSGNTWAANAQGSTWNPAASTGGVWVFDFLAPPVTSWKQAQLIANAVPGKDFPALITIPQTAFTCGKRTGYYADVETNCQVFHRCDLDGVKSDYLCTAGTVFNQVTLNCDWWYAVDCASSPKFESFANSRLYTNLPLFDTPPKDYVPKWVDVYYAQLYNERTGFDKKRLNSVI